MALRLLLCRLTPIDLFISEPKNWASLYTNLYGTRHCKRFVCSFPDWIMCCVPGTGRRQGKRGRHLAGGICGTLPRQQETVTTAVCFEKLKVEGMQGDWEKAESKDDGSLD